MKLSDVVSAMHLSIFAEVPLLIFMGVFLGVCVHVFRRSDQFQRAAELPLKQEIPPNRSVR